MKATKKEKQGKVISDKMDKTRTIIVDRLVKHPFYDKIIKKSSKFKVHDEKNESKIGDVIRVVETRPLSKDKCWKLVEIVEKNTIKEI
ncbi:30S ribosomal protein S17 [Candidatus Desantisbacteria bacterium]|nr:30S ribosomal protein S17 [Candidatus Desantisbacteria bacterium]